MIPALDISYRMFRHRPPGKIRYFKIIFLLLWFYYTDDLNFTEAVNEIE